ncbi:MAG: MFS transporter [Burkholderiaceae bacterium]|nr:MFS transporter [Burkholderiaceae bacterium]
MASNAAGAAPGATPAVVIALGCAQTLAWASSYYLAAILAAPIARDLGLAPAAVFAAFSAALVVSALVGPIAGRAIDRFGGRPVLMATNVVFAAGLAAMAAAQGALSLLLAWLVVGVGMGSGLYEAAFSTLVRLYGHQARNAITGITLIAGFASTVGWPLTAMLDAEVGWRGACLAWAALHLVVGWPLNARLPRAGSAAAVDPLPSRAEVPPAAASPAPAAQAPMQAAGASLAAAVAVGALVGPAQVAGRLLEFGLLRRLHPLLSARLAALAHPLGVLALVALGPAAAPAFALLHGAGNGILTIAKGTLPLALFGAQGYGARQGWLMLPARALQALAPWLYGLAIARWQAGALWLSAALMASAFAALLALRAGRRP